MSTRPTQLLPPRTEDTIQGALDRLLAVLPSSWSVTTQTDVKVGTRSVDAIVDILASDGTSATLLVKAKTTVEPRTVADLAAQTQSLAEALAETGPLPVRVVVARYLSRPVRERLEAADIGYIDETGNLLLRLDRPALFLRDVGSDSDPWRGPGRPQGTLKGATAARLVRALADFKPPLSVPELAKRSGASIGATYRMVEFLEREDLIAREPRSPISRVDWRGLIERWGDDLGVGQTERMTLYLEPRGIPELLTKLRTAGEQRYVLTGTLAARYYDEQVPPRLAMIYADPVEPLIEQLGLRPSPDGNVLVGTPINDVVFERSDVIAGLRVAAPSQIAVDLLGGPGRGPSEAEALLNWMEQNQDAWRK